MEATDRERAARKSQYSANLEKPDVDRGPLEKPPTVLIQPQTLEKPTGKEIGDTRPARQLQAALQQSATDLGRAERATADVQRAENPVDQKALQDKAAELQRQHPGLTPAGAKDMATINEEGFQVGAVNGTFNAFINLPGQPEAMPDEMGFLGNPSDPFYGAGDLESPEAAQGFGEAINRLRDLGYEPRGTDVNDYDNRVGPFKGIPKTAVGRELQYIRSRFASRNKAQQARLQQGDPTQSKEGQDALALERKRDKITRNLSEKEKRDLLSKRIRRQQARLLAAG